MGWRWHGKTRGAIGFALNFFVSFFFQEKKERATTSCQQAHFKYLQHL